MRVTYICLECEHQEIKWLGKCPKCQTWNSFEELTQTKNPKKTINRALNKESYNADNTSLSISEIVSLDSPQIAIGISELDRVLGGGLSVGSLTLIGGEPGIGKSTLLLSMCEKLATKFKNEKVLYVSAEESQGQIASRCRRLGISSKNILVFHETNWQKILDECQKINPAFLIIDSIQTIYSNEIQATAGSPGQIKEISYELMTYTKAKNITCFIVAHITKEGNIAGPKVLEHIVDTVLSFEGDQLANYRFLRAFKNRFGQTSELGIFEMTDKGLEGVINPSFTFVESTLDHNFGKTLTCTIEGTRPVIVEIQALAVESKHHYPIKMTQGYDGNRLSLIIAVIQRYLKIDFSKSDLFINIVGGFKIQTRGSDLSIIAALLSSFYEKSLNSQWVFLGELGLTGEVRPVIDFEQRVKELEKLNFQCVIVPHSNLKKMTYSPKRLKLRGVRNIDEVREIIQN